MDIQPKQTPPSPQPVMDIQPPRPTAVATPMTPVATEPVSNASISSPVFDQPTTDPSPLAAVPQAPKKHSRTPFVAIGIAVSLAVVFGAFTVVTYMKSDKTSSTTAQQNNAAATTVEKVAPSEADDTTSAVDTSLQSVDDSKDYDTNTLSDASLGL